MSWGDLKGCWVPHETRDAVLDFVRYWSSRTEIAMSCFIGWLEISTSKWYDWQRRYGQANQHNAPIPRDFWLEEWEKEAIVAFHQLSQFHFAPSVG